MSISAASIQNMIDWSKKVVSNSTGTTIVDKQLRESGVGIIDQLIAESTFASSITILTSQIIVNQANVQETLGGVIDSTKEYYLDGPVIVSGWSIVVPVTGLTINSNSNSIGKLINGDDGYTLFTSPQGGSGSLALSNIAIEVTGSGSQVFNLISSDGFGLIGMTTVQWNNCSSRGELNGFLQGIEAPSGITGGTPTLKLSGTWLGGWFIDVQRIGGLVDGAYCLYEEGTNFVMNGRFRSNANITLPANVCFISFLPASFPNASTLQLSDMIVNRNGVFNSEDSNITQNITKDSLPSFWKGNTGVPNTHVGGTLRVSVEVETTLVLDAPAVLLGTQVPFELVHFDSPVNGQLRHLAANPREYTSFHDFVIDGTAGDEYQLQLIKDDGEGGETIEYTQNRQIDALQGARNISYFTGRSHLELGFEEFCFWKIVNITASRAATIEIGSTWSVSER